MARMVKTLGAKSSSASVVVSFIANCVETLGLGVTAWASGSIALRAQTTAQAAEVAVTVFLLIGVLRSARDPDETHLPRFESRNRGIGGVLGRA